VTHQSGKAHQGDGAIGVRLVTPLVYAWPHVYRAASSPAPAPDGEYKIAFNDTDAPGGKQDIWLVNLDGSGRQNLTETPSSDEKAPAWSIDGTRIVAVGWSALMLYELGLDVNGDVAITSETNLAASGWFPGQTFIWPAWANTQDLVVVSTVSDLDYWVKLWLIDPLDPASPVQLTFGDRDDRVATFTPDDTRIIFDRSGARNHIMELDAFGNVVRLQKAGRWPNARRIDVSQ